MKGTGPVRAGTTAVVACRPSQELAQLRGPIPLFRQALLGATFTLCLWPDGGQSQPPADTSATTEQSCSFGMAKGDPTHQCQVPIPAGCVIAHFPGTKKPWTTISKAGRTLCKFEEKGTDWKTRITGQCTRCDSSQCTGQFMVRFDCSRP
jgi:hypothetical protein